MEAATALIRSHVRTLGDRLVIDALTIEDPVAVRLAREREQAGEDPARFVSDAVEIGARVLDREQAGLQADFVKAEFERAAHELEGGFAERSRIVTQAFDARLVELGQTLTRALETHFSDDSVQAVQHRVAKLVEDATSRSREDLLRQFSAADGANPLADFKAASVNTLRDMGRRQDEHLRALREKLAALEVHVERLHGDRAKQLEVAQERDRGTAKGRTYEEAVFAALDAIALAQGDDAQAVGDLRGAGGRKGDVVVELDACAGPARGRIVFEVKTSRLSRPAAVRELDEAREQRGADYAILVVPHEEDVPARLQQLREIGGDKLVVAYDPEDESQLPLEVAYKLARARVLMTRAEDDGIDAGALRDGLAAARGAMDDVRNIKTGLTNASAGIQAARAALETVEKAVRTRLDEIDAVLAASAGASDTP